MDYNKIKELQLSNNLSDAKFATSIGMSNPGYRSMLDKKTCTVKILENICTTYRVSADYLLFDSNVTYPNEVCKSCIKKDAIIEILQDQNKEKEVIISELNQNIGSLNAQLKNITDGSAGYKNTKAG